MSDVCTFDQIGPGDVGRAGGKGLGLADLARAGLPVPAGFCITTEAYRRLKHRSLPQDSALVAQIGQAYDQLGGGMVAVRSSATAEDGAFASFAGQQETILGVSGESALLDAIARCWASLESARAASYRRHQGLDESAMAMAVIVQRLVASEVSGVLFTRDPLDFENCRMLVEASWGLGETIVSGRVSPDRYYLNRDTGAVVERHISQKSIMTTTYGQVPVPPEKQQAACLTDEQLAQLASLGREVETLYGDARDVEWAWAEGRWWLLQARPITSAGALDRERVRREEVTALATRADARGTVWSRYNLFEVLPTPTPMTWAIVQRLLSGRGGFGLMYRDLGCIPDRALDEEGVFDLVCGRPYCNLSREPLMQFCGVPLAHSFSTLKAEPSKAFYPIAALHIADAGVRFWLLLPLILGRLFRFEVRLNRLSRTMADHLRTQIFPSFANEAEAEAARDLGQCSDGALLERLEYWSKRTLVDFARDSLKPTALAAVAMARLKTGLARHLDPEHAEAGVAELAMGVRPDPEADLPAAIRQLACGNLDRSTFFARFGHRGSQEMELSHPRWTEDPEALDQLLKTVEPKVHSGAHEKDTESEATAGGRLLSLLSKQKALQAHVFDLQTYMGLRETAKHYFMKGYALVRRLLVEVDRRHQLHGGIFYLVPEELPELVRGRDFSRVIAERRRRRSIVLGLDVPPVLFSDDLEAIGRPSEVSGADTLQGMPLSAGVAEGPALVLEEPVPANVPGEPYILVCPSTDPAWVPLFTHARGLVMETGGVLSHGAIVAREFGLPAVAGLTDITRRVRSGQRLRVDGGTGMVVIEPGLQ
jgi:pyruvate,water dikinase